MAADATTLIDRIGHWVADLKLDQIPTYTQTKIRLQIATAVSAAGWTPWNHSANVVLKAKRSVGKAFVYATGERIAPADAAFVNSAFAMSFDCDDYMLTGHTSHSTIQVPLAYSDDLDNVVLAAAAANEVIGRISTVCLFGPLNGQMSSYIHNIGAAIAWAKVHDLDAQQTANALALALYQPNYCQFPGFWHEDSKSVTASQPQAHGIAAAELAAAGLQGATDILDHPLGFFQTFSFVDFPGLFDGLGTTWFSDTLGYKRYPGTSYIAAGVEGALQLSEGRRLRATDIEAIRVDTTILSATLDDIGSAAINRSPLDANAVNFSLKLSIAAALYFGDLTPDHLHPEDLADSENELRAIAAKVTVVHDLSFTLAMLGSSPVGLRVIANLKWRQLRNLIGHVRTLRRGAGGQGLSKTNWLGGLPALGRMLRQLRKARGQRVTDTDFDARNFPMLQSARVTADFGHGSATADVPIPIGGCGRDDDAARAVVRWRCEQVYGDQGPAVFAAALHPATSVAGLEQATGRPS